jgi:hypothetical protein
MSLSPFVLPSETRAALAACASLAPAHRARASDLVCAFYAPPVAVAPSPLLDAIANVAEGDAKARSSFDVMVALRTLIEVLRTFAETPPPARSCACIVRNCARIAQLRERVFATHIETLAPARVDALRGGVFAAKGGGDSDDVAAIAAAADAYCRDHVRLLEATLGALLGLARDATPLTPVEPPAVDAPLAALLQEQARAAAQKRAAMAALARVDVAATGGAPLDDMLAYMFYEKSA